MSTVLVPWTSNGYGVPHRTAIRAVAVNPNENAACDMERDRSKLRADTFKAKILFFPSFPRRAAEKLLQLTDVNWLRLIEFSRLEAWLKVEGTHGI